MAKRDKTVLGLPRSLTLPSVGTYTKKGTHNWASTWNHWAQLGHMDMVPQSSVNGSMFQALGRADKKSLEALGPERSISPAGSPWHLQTGVRGGRLRKLELGRGFSGFCCGRGLNPHPLVPCFPGVLKRTHRAGRKGPACP